MKYAAIRIRKGTQQYLEAMSRHGDPKARLSMPHVDHARSHLNRFLVGTPSMKQDVENFYRSKAPKQRKNDTTKFAHALLIASPEYFRPDGQPAGEYDEKRLENWVAASMNWAQDTFGDNLVHARLDLDEATPHIDLAIVPTYTKSTKRGSTQWVSFKKVLGTPEQGAKYSYAEWQDRYASACAHLGLSRGRSAAETHRTHESPTTYRMRQETQTKRRIKKAQDRIAVQKEARSAFDNREVLDAELSSSKEKQLVFCADIPRERREALLARFQPFWGVVWKGVRDWAQQRREDLQKLRNDARQAFATRHGAHALIDQDALAIARGIRVRAQIEPNVTPSPPRELERE